MTTRKIGNDLPGSSFTRGHNDARKDKAVRRIMYHHTGDKAALLAHIELGTYSEAFRLSDGTQVPRVQGTDDQFGNPVFTGGQLVHPEDTTLNLQTTKVTKVGRDRWIAVLTYFRIITDPYGGGPTPGSVLKLRCDFESHRVYTDGVPVENGPYEYFNDYALPGGSIIAVGCPTPPVGGGEGTYGDDGGDGNEPDEEQTTRKTNPNSFSRTILLPIVRLQIPFASYVNPFTYAGNVGGLNSKPVDFGENLSLQENMVRFDGVQMDEMGSVTSSNGQSGRFFGVYQFSLSPTQFFEQVPKYCGGKWTIELVRSVNERGSWATFSELGLS
jgi:hypothetical protein